MPTEPGTIIHGTHRICDLVPALLSVLREDAPEKAREIEARYGGLVAQIENHDGPLDIEVDDTEHDNANFLVEELFDALDAIAPEGCYFGSIEGDGSDFGFWGNEPEAF